MLSVDRHSAGPAAVYSAFSARRDTRYSNSVPIETTTSFACVKSWSSWCEFEDFEILVRVFRKRRAPRAGHTRHRHSVSMKILKYAPI